MDLPLIIASFSSLIFGTFAIIYSLKVEKYHRRLQTFRSKERDELTQLIDRLDDGIIILDTNHQINLINKKAKDILVLQKEHPMINDLLSILPNTYNFTDKIDNAMKLNQEIEEKDIPYQNKWLNIKICPCLNAGASFLIHDVTAEKSAAQKKEEVRRMLSHELRAPLTSIRASAELLTKTKLTEDENRRLLTIISEQASKMLNQVASIVDNAKLTESAT